MPYTKTVWVDGQAPALDDTNLNKIEGGIETAQAAAEAAQADADAAAQAVVDHEADTLNVHGIANTAVIAATTASFTTAKDTKLSGIETGADVTDAANVIAAGAAMVSRWDSGTSTWEPRDASAPFGWLFISTNDASATAPDDANLQTGDIWDTHPEAI